MQTIPTLLLFTLTSIAPAAPAPPPHAIPPSPPPLTIHGTYTLLWANTPYYMLLCPCGRYTCSHVGPYPVIWQGSWTYYGGVLRVHETTDDGRHWSFWQVAIDGYGKGEAVSSGELRTKVSMRKLKRNTRKEGSR